MIVMLVSAPAAADIEVRLGALVQGRSDQSAIGVEGAVEHVGDRLSYGVEVISTGSADRRPEMFGPDELGVLAGPTASWRLGSTDVDEDGFAMHGLVRASVDVGRITADRWHTWTAVPRLSLEGRAGDRDMTMILAMGYAYGIGGRSNAEDPQTPELGLGGVDVRIAFGRRF